MAIKKGAFDLYTQERQLPNKKTPSQNKANHFFDDVDKTAIGLEFAQKKITNNNEPVTNGSQSVHNPFTSHESDHLINQQNQTEKELSDTTTIGSQMVHNRFTNNKTDHIRKQRNQIRKEVDDNITIGSQSVHNQFTDHESDHNSNQQNQNEKELDDNTINGSQMVHDRFTKNEFNHISNQQNQTEKGLDDNTTNGSQSVYNKINHSETNLIDEHILGLEKIPKICFSKLVGNQREIIIALYKNMRINKSDTTDELTLESISKLTGVNQKSLKNTLFRLSNAGLLIRADQKVGRGGWVKYKLNTHLVKEIQQKEFLR